MGNYLFNADILLDALREAHETGHSDFGKHILPSMLKSHRLMAYDFDTNTIPGTEPYEEHGYWRDVGTIDAYYQAHFDTLGATPRFRMTNRHWPIYASPDQAESAQIENGVIHRSVVGSAASWTAPRWTTPMLRAPWSSSATHASSTASSWNARASAARPGAPRHHRPGQ